MIELIENNHEVIFNHWGPEEVVDLVGPGGSKIWVQFSGELLKGGEYSVVVDPDSAVPQSRQAREQKALIIYEQFKANPLIDPTKLTQYLLHEMHGAQFDDMMRALPAQQGQGGLSPNDPISPQQFTQSVAGGLRQGAANAA